MRRLAPLFVWDADDGHLLYGGMAQEDALDLDRGDVLAAADDDVLDPIANLDVPVGLDDRCIAGVEPAVGHRLPGCLRVAVVAIHHGVTADHDLSQGSRVVGHLPPLLVHHAQVAGCDQLHARAGLDDGSLLAGESRMFGQGFADCNERRGFGQPIHLRDLPAKVTLQPLDGCRRGRSPGGDDVHAAWNLTADLGWSVGQPDQHRGRGAHPAHALIPDKLEDGRRLHPG